MANLPFPKELTSLKQWVCWRLEPNPKGSKDSKIPYCPASGKRASSTDPKSWTTCEVALAAKERYLYTGVGFVFVKGGGIIGVDIDHCIDANGKLNQVAADILAMLPPTYIEVSPSGSGLHIFLKGEMPSGGCKNSKTGVEMYAHSRYFTMTGKPFTGSVDSVAEGNGALQKIHSAFIRPKQAESKKRRKRKSKSAALTDEELLEKARSAGNGDNFNLLWEGKWQDLYNSQSEADMALCCNLAFWSAKNREQMDRLFRQSALLRPKWDERHHANGATYGEETLDRAIEATESVYSPDSDASIFQFADRYFRAKGDKIYPITNFIIKPVEMLVSDDEAQLTADLVTVNDEAYRQTFMTSDFANPQKFKNVLNKRTIALSYLGSEGDLELFKIFINELPWEKKVGVNAIGIYEHDERLVFVSADGAVATNNKAVDDIVQLEKQQSIRSGILSKKMLSPKQMLDIGAALMTFNEPIKAVAVLAWAAACFIKPHLKKSGIKFPHMFCIGEAGSGKSNTMERIILPIFSRSKVTAATQVTAFTLMRESASSNLIPQPLDEFKPSKMDKYKQSILYNHFRDAYDGHEGIRGRADQQIVSYELLAPMIIAGEESADEAAVRERSIELLFSKKDLQSSEYKTAFRKLCMHEDLLSSFGRSLLDAALRSEFKEVSKWYDEAMLMFSDSLPARVVSNLAGVFCGLRLVAQLLGELKLKWSEVFPINVMACRDYLERGVREYLFDGGDSNKSVVEQTFEVMARMNLSDESDYEVKGGVLSLWLNHIYDKYTKYRREFAVSGEVLTYTQFKKQLEHSDIFIAKNKQMWLGNANRKVWQVDFAKLSARCDVSGFEADVEPLSGAHGTN
jgi:hypothetical protein